MAMTIVTAEKVYREGQGDYYLAYIVAEEEPSKTDITGADVIGCNDDDRFAAGSVIEYPDGKYKAFKDGVFTQKG